MESYAADRVAASGEPAGGGDAEPGLARLAAEAEAAEPGAGQALVAVIGLLRTVKRRGMLDEMEAVTAEGARRIGQGVLQAALDEQAFAECWLPGVTGSDGVRRARRADSSTSLLTMLGQVRVRRAAYLSGDRGVPALHPRDAVLNLPPGGFSWQVRKLAEVTCRSGAYGSAAEGHRHGDRDRHRGPAAAGDDAGLRGRRGRVRAAPPGPGPARADGPGRDAQGRRRGGVRGRQGRQHAAEGPAQGRRPQGREERRAGRPQARVRPEEREQAGGPDLRGL